MTTHVLQSVAATASAGMPMYFVDALEPFTDDPRKARKFSRAEAEKIQTNTAGWVAAVRCPPARTWGAGDRQERPRA